MTKDVTVQEMQEHFAEHMEEVRRGTTLRLVEGSTLIAEIVPRETDHLLYRRASKAWKDFVPPPPLDPPIDVVALLREDRDAR